MGWPQVTFCFPWRGLISITTETEATACTLRGYTITLSDCTCLQRGYLHLLDSTNAPTFCDFLLKKESDLTAIIVGPTAF